MQYTNCLVARRRSEMRMAFFIYKVIFCFYSVQIHTKYEAYKNSVVPLNHTLDLESCKQMQNGQLLSNVNNLKQTNFICYCSYVPYVKLHLKLGEICNENRPISNSKEGEIFKLVFMPTTNGPPVSAA